MNLSTTPRPGWTFLELTFRLGLGPRRRRRAEEARIVDVEALPVEREAPRPAALPAPPPESGGKRLGRYVDIYV